MHARGQRPPGPARTMVYAQTMRARAAAILERARRLPPWAAPALIFALALALRLAYVAGDARSPFFDHRLADAADYANLAAAYTRGAWPGPEAFFRPPLYPLLLGLVFQTFGPGVGPQLVLQSILGAGTCALTHAVAVEALGDRRRALAAGLLCACSGALIYFDGEPLSGGLDAFLLVLSVYLLQRAARREGLAPWIIAGAAIGLAATNRGGALLLVPIAAVWAARRASRRSAAAVVLAAALPVLPVAWHDARYDQRPEHYYTFGFSPPAPIDHGPGATLGRLTSGRVAPLGWADGVNLYVGNDPAMEAVNHVLHPDHFTRFQALLAEPFAAGVTTASGHSRYFRDKARAAVAANPGAWIKLMGRKALALVNGVEIPRGSVPYAHRRYSAVLAILLWRRGIAFPDGLVIPLGLLGLYACRARLRDHLPIAGALAAQALFVLAFFVSGRYRLPLIPLLSIYAAAALDRAVAWARAARRRLKPAALGAAALLACNLPVVDVPDDFGAYEHYNLANDLYDARDLPGAVEHFRASLAIDPDQVSARNNLAWALRGLGKLPEAEVELREALRRDPRHTRAHNNLGVVLADLGRPDEALAEYAEAVRLDPGYARARYNWGLLLRARGRRAEAAAQLAEAAGLAPAWPDPLVALADMALEDGDPPRAAGHLKRALAARPGDPRLRALLERAEAAGQGSGAPAAPATPPR